MSVMKKKVLTSVKLTKMAQALGNKLERLWLANIYSIGHCLRVQTEFTSVQHLKVCCYDASLATSYRNKKMSLHLIKRCAQTFLSMSHA
jgi:hypothetical protein